MKSTLLVVIPTIHSKQLAACTHTQPVSNGPQFLTSHFVVSISVRLRAPNVGELFQGSAIGFPGANDPCATAAASTGGLRAVCAANGVSAALLDQLGSADPAVAANASNLIQPDPQIAAFCLVVTRTCRKKLLTVTRSVLCFSLQPSLACR